jgi:putative membrane protein
MHIGYWRDDWNDWWWWIPMSLGMLAFWAVLVVLIVLLVRQGRGQGASHQSLHAPPYPPVPGHPASSPTADPTAEARRILAERLARGDIDLDDYRRRLEALETAGNAPARPPS